MFSTQVTIIRQSGRTDGTVVNAATILQSTWGTVPRFVAGWPQYKRPRYTLVSTDNLVMIYSAATQNKRYCAGVPPMDELVLQSLNARYVMHLQYPVGRSHIYPGEGHLPNLA
jgi:hypothetical protein